MLNRMLRNICLMSLIFWGCDSGPAPEKITFQDIQFPITFEQRAEQYRGVTVPSAVIEKWNNKKVSMNGFMLPLNADKEVKEFMLVKDLWTCCYGDAPDLNQVVYVKSEKPVEFFQQSIQVKGTLSIGPDKQTDGTIRSFFQISADSVKKGP